MGIILMETHQICIWSGCPRSLIQSESESSFHDSDLHCVFGSQKEGRKEKLNYLRVYVDHNIIIVPDYYYFSNFFFYSGEP